MSVGWSLPGGRTPELAQSCSRLPGNHMSDSLGGGRRSESRSQRGAGRIETSFLSVFSAGDPGSPPGSLISEHEHTHTEVWPRSCGDCACGRSLCCWGQPLAQCIREEAKGKDGAGLCEAQPGGGGHTHSQQGVMEAGKGLRGKPGFSRGAVSPGALIPAQILNAESGCRRKEEEKLALQRHKYTQVMGGGALLLTSKHLV